MGLYRLWQMWTYRKKVKVLILLRGGWPFWRQIAGPSLTCAVDLLETFEASLEKHMRCKQRSSRMVDKIWGRAVT